MKPFPRLGRLKATYLAMLGLSIAQPATAEESFVTQQSKADALTFTLITGDKVSAIVNKDGKLGGIRLVNADGSDTFTSIFKRGNNTYVVPNHAQALVDSNAIDLELFNINKLYESGYDDASTDALPVIVEYRDGTLAGPAVPATLAGMSLTGEIELIDSAAFAINKDKAAQTWQTLVEQADVEGLWLDAVVHAHKVTQSETLTPTVPLTGAYGESAINYNGAGIKVAVLDTGYDTEHPDLQGRVIASRDFTYSSNGVDDLNGHGTHTASTVAGNGHESEGKWVGVAPAADLIIGKVLSNTGSGSTYGILNGMQWAVLSEHANIVNMSLGGTATTCSGPLVEMVEALSDKALFVISAGNSFTRETIGSPGCAPSALTVGAIDRDGNTASFSSRGPSPDGHSAKPDIASQGVSVVAAASGGLGDTAYRVYSGTSMAAPHVAGGAAIVMQARQDLTPKEIKDVLTSSVFSGDSHVLEQGAGAMNIDRAIDQAIVAPANRELGYFDNANSAFTETQITLTNTSDESIKLKLKLDLIGEDGKTQLPATLAGLDIKSVTIPAKGVAQVPMWIDPSVALNNSAYGAITGRITGTTVGNTDQQVTVPVSFWIDQPHVNLTVNLTDRWGNQAGSPSKLYLINEEDDWGSLVRLTGGKANIDVPAGYYTLIANIMTYDNQQTSSGLVESAAQMAVLNRKIDGKTEINFDARNAQPVTFKADQPLDPQGYSFGFTYAIDDQEVAKLAAIEMAPDYVNDMYAWSQGHDDRFRSFITTRAVAPETTVTMQNGVELDYIKQGLALSFHGEGSAEVVPVGDAGYSTDWSQFELDGKIALIANPNYLTSYMVGNAMKNGASGVIFYRPGRGGRYKGAITGTPKVPVIGISTEQGEALMAEIEAGNNIVSWSGIAAERSPYAYSINHITDGRIQSGQINIAEHKMHKMSASYHSQNDERPAWTDVMAMTNSTGEFYSTGSSQLIMLPHQRDEYYTASTKNAWTNVVMPNYQIQSGGAYFDGPRAMTEGAEQSTTWFKGPRAGSLGSSGSAIISRDTNVLYFNLASFGDAANHDGIFGFMGSSAFGLKVNGEPASPYQGTLTLEPGSHQITLEMRSYARGVGERSPINDKLGSLYQGFYTFTADEQQQGVQPILMPMVDLPVDINNSMKVGEAAHVKLTGLLDGVGEVALADVQFQYAYGQECTIANVPAYIYCPVSTKFSSENWLDAQVEHIDGEWVATIPNTGNVGDFVHIRTIVSDYGSSQAEQITMRAYMLD